MIFLGGKRTIYPIVLMHKFDPSMIAHTDRLGQLPIVAKCHIID